MYRVIQKLFRLLVHEASFCARSKLTLILLVLICCVYYRTDLCCKAGVELELIFYQQNEAFE